MFDSLQKELQKPSGFSNYIGIQSWVEEEHGIHVSYSTLYKIVQGSALSFDLFESPRMRGYGQRASLPALAGPHAARAWAKILKNLTTPYYPLN